MEAFLVLFLLTVVIYIFIRISQRLRRGGGSLSTTMSGATNAFLNRDKKQAAVQIAELKSDKKLAEQENGEPESKINLF